MTSDELREVACAAVALVVLIGVAVVIKFFT